MTLYNADAKCPKCGTGLRVSRFDTKKTYCPKYKTCGYKGGKVT